MMTPAISVAIASPSTPYFAADLHARPAERRDQKAGDDGGVEPALGTDAAGDGERDGEWERDNADDDAGDDIPSELLPGIILQRGDEFGDEHARGKIPVARPLAFEYQDETIVSASSRRLHVPGDERATDLSPHFVSGRL
jgi:hypothetical protein